MRLLNATAAQAAADMAARYQLLESGHRLAAAAAHPVRAARLQAAALEAGRISRRFAQLAQALQGRELGRATLRQLSLDPAAGDELLRLLTDLSVRAPLARPAA